MSDLTKLGREDLDLVAAAVGVENPGDLPNKPAVADAILAAAKPEDAAAQRILDAEKARDGAVEAQKAAEGQLKELQTRFGALTAEKAKADEALAEATKPPPEPEYDRLPIDRRDSTGEWKCPFCQSPAGSNESKLTTCTTPMCGAVVDGGEVVRRVDG